MANGFDLNFEKHKPTFKQKYGKEWNADPALYTEYLQIIYLSGIFEVVNSGIGMVQAYQKETNEVLRSVSQKLDKLK